MAERPWITSDDVKNYTESQKVKLRENGKFAIDITRAEQYIITRTNNTFGLGELPEDIRIAAILLADYYAKIACENSNTQGIKSETFDDYSYTKFDSTAGISIKDLSIDDLIEPYVLNGKFDFRLRKL